LSTAANPLAARRIEGRLKGDAGGKSKRNNFEPDWRGVKFTAGARRFWAGVHAIARAAFAALFAAWFAAPNLAHAVVIVGAPASTGSGDCIPFGCNFFDESNTDYQQVYGSTNFSGPITITALEFFHTVDFSGGGTEPQAGSYVISLSTTQAAVNGLDATDLSNNLGPDNTTVYSGDVPTLSGSVLKFILTTPFTYDPSKGNLLLDVQGGHRGDHLF
jgi:hypothetical protein